MTSPSNRFVPTILGLSSAFPEHVATQDELWNDPFSRWYAHLPEAREVMAQTRVKRRHLTWDPAVELKNGGRGTGARMQAYEQAAVRLGENVCGRALDRSGAGRGQIGSFVLASCTGYAGPTADLHIAGRLGLRTSLRRTFVGHMGCSAAFNALKLGIDALTARPDEAALVACIEFSSLQFRPEPATLEQAIIHALFGDAAAALVLTMAEPGAVAGAGTQILATHTEQVYGSAEHMTWTVLDDGFQMSLSPYVPFILSGQVEAFVAALCARASVPPEAIRHWGIHPGGPKIVNMIAERLAISQEQLSATWRVLETRGNCSSTTILLILEEILKRDHPGTGELGLIMAFGPGLTMEGALVRF
jgi:predicted naringenin-chalcone synthase